MRKVILKFSSSLRNSLKELRIIIKGAIIRINKNLINNIEAIQTKPDHIKIRTKILINMEDNLIFNKINKLMM